jgi:hypothetical protein
VLSVVGIVNSVQRSRGSPFLLSRQISQDFLRLFKPTDFYILFARDV